MFEEITSSSWPVEAHLALAVTMACHESSQNMTHDVTDDLTVDHHT